MINVIFCGYRQWAKNVIDAIGMHPNINVTDIIYNDQDEKWENLENGTTDADIIIFIGWSWRISNSITSKYLCLGIHPSDLPEYRGGSPLQNQIIDGVYNTKVTLFSLTSKLDSGDIWMKGDLNLEGDSFDIILKKVESASIDLLSRFFYAYPNISLPVKQENTSIIHKRRTPEQSRITIDEIQNTNLKALYDKIRCLTDPYPNAYIEDSAGNRLLITSVKYIQNDIK